MKKIIVFVLLSALFAVYGAQTASAGLISSRYPSYKYRSHKYPSKPPFRSGGTRCILTYPVQCF